MTPTNIRFCFKKTRVTLWEDDCKHRAILVHSRGVKSSKLDKSNQSKFGLIQPLFPTDDRLACIIRVLSLCRGEKRRPQITRVVIVFCRLWSFVKLKARGGPNRSIDRCSIN